MSMQKPTRRQALVAMLFLSLFISLSLLNIIIATEQTVLDESYVTDTFEDENVYTNITAGLQRELERDLSSGLLEGRTDIEPGGLAERVVTEEYTRAEIDRNVRNMHQYLRGDRGSLELFLDYTPVKSGIESEVDQPAQSAGLQSLPDRVSFGDAISSDQLEQGRSLVSQFVLFQIVLPIGILAILGLLFTQTRSSREFVGITGLAAIAVGVLFIPVSLIMRELIGLLFIVPSRGVAVDPSSLINGIIASVEGTMSWLVLQSTVLLLVGSVLFAISKETDKRLYPIGDRLGVPGNEQEGADEEATDSDSTAEGSVSAAEVEETTETVEGESSGEEPDPVVEEIDGISDVSHVGSRGLLSVSTATHDGRDTPVYVLTVASDTDITADINDAFRETVQAWLNVSTHPNVVSVVEWDDDPEPWLVLETPEGRPLSTCVEELEVDDALSVIEDTAEALRNAALYNTQHLNLSPEYVWTTLSEEDARGVVDDWGLDRVIRTAHDESHVTAYTAPEQLPTAGAEAHVTERTDVYGLAAVAYYALTGEPPVEPTTDAIQAGEVVPPSEVSDLPKSLDEPLVTGLATDQDDRYESIYLFKSELEQAL